jgi:competence protein ComGC
MNYQKALTFVELLIVITVIAIVSAMFIPPLFLIKAENNMDKIRNFYPRMIKGNINEKDKNDFHTAYMAIYEYVDYDNKNISSKNKNQMKIYKKLIGLENHYKYKYSHYSKKMNNILKEDQMRIYKKLIGLKMNNILEEDKEDKEEEKLESYKEKIESLNEEIKKLKENKISYSYKIENKKEDFIWKYVLIRMPDNKTIFSSKQRSDCENVKKELEFIYEITKE